VFLCVVLSCVARSLGAGLTPRPRSPTKCLSKKKNPKPEKGIRKNGKEEEFQVISASDSFLVGNRLRHADQDAVFTSVF
jgi:hypothetical protein